MVKIMKRLSRNLEAIASLVTFLFLFTFVHVANAQQSPITIYIQSDGSISSTSSGAQINLTRVGNSYYFTGDIFGSLVVEKDSIVISGNGWKLYGNGMGKGIEVNGRSNVTIANLSIANFDTGIELYGSSNITIENCTVANNGVGLHLYGSKYVSIIGNTISANYYGIDLYSSTYNTIYGNNITGSVFYGLNLGYGSNFNLIYLNNFIDNKNHVNLEGSLEGNSWDNGTYGNYWSGNSCSAPGSSLTCGSGYAVSQSGDIDRYPLAEPISLSALLSQKSITASQSTSTTPTSTTSSSTQIPANSTTSLSSNSSSSSSTEIATALAIAVIAAAVIFLVIRRH